MLGVLKINVEFSYLFLTESKNLCVHVPYLNYTTGRNGLNETTALTKGGGAELVFDRRQESGK